MALSPYVSIFSRSLCRFMLLPFTTSSVQYVYFISDFNLTSSSSRFLSSSLFFIFSSIDPSLPFPPGTVFSTTLLPKPLRSFFLSWPFTFSVPASADFNPMRISSMPRAPASTTLACFRTGSKKVVLSTDFSVSPMMLSSSSSSSISLLFSHNPSTWACISFIAVSMVPSVGSCTDP